LNFSDKREAADKVDGSRVDQLPEIYNSQRCLDVW